MANIERQENTTTGVVMFGALYQQNTLVATAAIVLAAGTVLGRITADGKLKEYDAAAVDGSEIPVAILQNEVEFTAAGEQAVNAIISGEVRAAKVSAYDGGAQTALTVAEIQALRDFTIIVRETDELSEFDN